MDTRTFFLNFARFTFALALIAFSYQQLQYGSFRPVILPDWSGWPHGHTYMVYLCSVVMIAAGIGLLVVKDVRWFASLLGTAILVLVLIGHLPYELAHNMSSIGPWTNTFKALAFSGSAFIIASGYPIRKRVGGFYKIQESLIPWGPVFFAIFLIVCGIEHFVYFEFVKTLVPAGLRGHGFWTYFAAIALMGSGLAFILRIQVRLVAILLGIMLFLWVFMVHIPRAVADPHSLEGNEITSVFQALAYSGVAWALAVIWKKTRQG